MIQVVRMLCVAAGCVLMMAWFRPLAAQTTSDIDPEALIEQIIATEMHQRDSLKDVTFESQYIEGEETDKGFKEKVRFNKKVQIKYFRDTAWYHEE